VPNEGTVALVVGTKDKERHYIIKPITVASGIHTITLYFTDFRCQIDSMSEKIVNPAHIEVTFKKLFRNPGSAAKV
jgi:hypothetical protein